MIPISIKQAILNATKYDISLGIAILKYRNIV